MQLQDMNENSSFSHAIDQEAIQSRANANLQNPLPGKHIVIKTTQLFLKVLVNYICHYEVHNWKSKFP